MKYDDASWHSGGDFPATSPEEYGATHIALMLKWCFLKGWAGELHAKEFPEEYSNFINGDVSATKYFLDNCDGKFTDEDLNDEGNAFMQYYYGDEGDYLSDYATVFEELMYEKGEEEHDFSKFSEMVENRYQEFLKRKNA